MLEHLILQGRGGLCNRLRAIASGRRLCRRFGAKCSLIWDWGHFWHFFAPLPDLDVFSWAPVCSGWHQQVGDQPPDERVIDVRAATAKVRAGVVFWGHDEPPIWMAEVAPFIPQLHERLARTVDEFAAARLTRAVGFHIRRTDNARAIAGSPDELFLSEAERLIDAGWQIFLATDNRGTEQMMIERFGAHIVTHPRRRTLAQRWPRPRFDAAALDDDLLDLFLLARTHYVIGSHGSSFTGVAMALNGSPQCHKLALPNAPGPLRAA